MYLLKNLMIVAFMVMSLSSSIFAGDESEGSALKAERISGMGCPEAVEQLKEKIELNQQLGSAYLQTYQTLNDVYEVWGDKLGKFKNLEEVSKVADFSKVQQLQQKMQLLNPPE